MTNSTTLILQDKSCRPCEGGVPALSSSEAERLLQLLDGWELVDEGQKIRRRWTVKDFVAGIDFLRRVAELAESEGHHPDVSLSGYRHVTIELTTNAIGGLSENDFILAAKIDDLEVSLHEASAS